MKFTPWILVKAEIDTEGISIADQNIVITQLKDLLTILEYNSFNKS